VDADVVIVGGGLAGGLVALAYRLRAPDVRVLVVEAAPALGGNHTWSFHDSDVPAEAAELIAPLVGARWPSYDVAFPDLRREVALGYASIFAADFDRVVRAALGDRLVHTRAEHVGARQVVLADGRLLTGTLVLDARGPDARASGNVAYQKFVGLELQLATPAPALRATIMDATVEQDDGMRFVYTLPFRPDRVLVEDTVLSDHPALDHERYHARALAYAAGLGLDVARVARVEHGILPLPLDGGGPDVPDDDDGPCRIGYQGGWLHPTTGYSLPAVVRLAWTLAAVAPADALAPGSPVRVLARDLHDSAAFARLLNRLLFRATPPGDRWRVLERFHRLPDDLIARFYRLEIRRRDRLRILCGRPPRGVSLRAAFSQLTEIP
jgi:lycopene beta-cyclase